MFLARIYRQITYIRKFLSKILAIIFLPFERLLFIRMLFLNIIPIVHTEASSQKKQTQYIDVGGPINWISKDASAMIRNQPFHRTPGNHPDTDSQIESDILQYILKIPGYRANQMNRQVKTIVLFHISGKKG